MQTPKPFSSTLNSPVPPTQSKKFAVPLLLILLSVSLTFNVILTYQTYLANNQSPPQTQQVPTPSPTTNTLVQLKMGGGIAGVDDQLTINIDGTASFIENNTGSQEDFKIGPDSLAQLVNLANKLGNFTHYESDPPEIVDGMSTEIEFYGQGSQQPSPEQISLLRTVLNSILRENGFY